MRRAASSRSPRPSTLLASSSSEAALVLVDVEGDSLVDVFGGFRYGDGAASLFAWFRSPHGQEPASIASFRDLTAVDFAELDGDDTPDLVTLSEGRLTLRPARP